ncbi:MAG: ATP-binding protein [Campylobacterota bacterium]|nr:ATP-binding protein [Campylobacterota bacterium]
MFIRREVDRLKLVILLAFILIYGIFVYINTYSKNSRIELALNEQIKTLKIHYSLTKDYFITDAIVSSGCLLNNDEAITLFSKVNNSSKKQKDILRKELYEILLPMYKRIKMKGVLQFHFVLPNNKSFLRMHKPNKYGDDLSNIRYSFNYVNKTRKVIEGFEQGRTTHAFRYVFPYYDKKGDYLGAIEISLASYALQQKLLKINKIHSHFLVNKNIFLVKAWEEKDLIQKYIQSIENDDYMYALTKDSNQKILDKNAKNLILPLKEKIVYKMSLNKPFALFVNSKEIAKVITFLPIKDTEENTAAYLVSYTNNDNIYNISKSYKYLNIIIFIGLVIILYFIYKNINYRRELSNEVHHKNNDLINLNNNIENKIITAVEKNNDIQENLYKSQKMVAMSEMIMNISHQWRQPLSVISTAATGIELQKKHGNLTDDLLIYFSHTINNNAQYLGKILDSFNDIIKDNRVKKKFNLNDDIDDFLKIVEAPIRMEQINLVLDLQENITINGYPIELIECLHNIFNNSKDILRDKTNDEDKLIFISSSKVDNNLFIKIKDNGGGVPQDIIGNIFEPYFTTKHRSQGTGLGLHVAYKLIIDNMEGSLSVKNVEYKYNDKEYIGAEFTISIPIG